MITFQLSQADARPMYQQIMEHIKTLVIEQTWPAGKALPSIREMAAALKVSVITVKRAYQELEHEGVIVTRQGMGSFVAELSDQATAQKAEELKHHLNQAIQLSKLLQLDDKALVSQLKQLMQAKKHTPESPHD